MPITLSTAPVAEVRALAAETLAANDPIVASKFRLQFGCEAQQFINMTTKRMACFARLFSGNVLRSYWRKGVARRGFVYLVAIVRNLNYIISSGTAITHSQKV